ncbi:hypothetical protein V1Y59_01270 [Gordonia sp. PKS22-38]|uniref:Uncharacterized protein n=1 Tax=Gordonia prachuapensis TaxID=3115651 RepID=A0ABU7MMZ3_9ACTN|nr:hypothetical protein [Gordonia sp. PKS22-38]
MNALVIIAVALLALGTGLSGLDVWTTDRRGRGLLRTAQLMWCAAGLLAMVVMAPSLSGLLRADETESIGDLIRMALLGGVVAIGSGLLLAMYGFPFGSRRDMTEPVDGHQRDPRFDEYEQP